MSYICERCDKGLKSQKSLNYHIKNNVCVEKKIISCPKCEKVFPNRSKREQHLDNVKPCESPKEKEDRLALEKQKEARRVEEVRIRVREDETERMKMFERDRAIDKRGMYSLTIEDRKTGRKLMDPETLKKIREQKIFENFQNCVFETFSAEKIVPLEVKVKQAETFLDDKMKFTERSSVSRKAAEEMYYQNIFNSTEVYDDFIELTIAENYNGEPDKRSIFYHKELEKYYCLYSNSLVLNEIDYIKKLAPVFNKTTLFHLEKLYQYCKNADIGEFECFKADDKNPTEICSVSISNYFKYKNIQKQILGIKNDGMFLKKYADEIFDVNGVYNKLDTLQLESHNESENGDPLNESHLLELGDSGSDEMVLMIHH
jgi:hypothetical protein